MAITTLRETPTASPRVATYTRLSDESDRGGNERQLADVTVHSTRTLRGEIIGNYSDPEASAYRKGVKRPGFDAMLDDFRAGLFDTIVVWRIDRLARAFREWAKVLVLVDDHGLRIVDCNGIDTATAGGRNMLGILSEQARSESATISLRVRRALRDKAEQGKPARSRHRGFGHASDGAKIVEAEAVLIREAAERVVAGETVGDVLRDWHPRGVVNTLGRPWSYRGLSRLLTSARMVGAREVDGELYASGGIQPILDHSTLVKVRAALAPGSRPRGRPLSAGLVAGIAVCGHCGQLLSGGSDKVEGALVPTYVCATRHPGAARAGCGRLSVRRAALDEYVGGVVLGALEGVAGEPQGTANEVSAVARLQEIAETKGELAAMWARKELAPVEWRAARDALIDEERHLSARLTRRRRVVADDVRSQWATRPVSWRAALVRTVVERVVVAPAVKGNGPRFRPDRVRIEWQPEEPADTTE